MIAERTKKLFFTFLAAPVLLAGYSVWRGFALTSEAEELHRVLERIQLETQARLGVQERPSRIVVVRAPFATWADLVSGIHRVGARAGLDDFSYGTGSVVALQHADSHLVLDDGVAPEDSFTQPADAAEEPGGPEPPAPYRAMTAVVRGRGSYGAIARFTSLLAENDPALTLDRLRIEAGFGSLDFEAVLHLATALPVEPPEMVSVPDADRGAREQPKQAEQPL